MKLIKKMLAIMFAFVMVLGMSTNVKADEVQYTITINNAKDGNTYSIYKILELESYDAKSGLYSYKPAAEWKKFLNTDKAKQYMTINEDGYVNWIEDENTGVRVAEFAKLALNYAKDKNHLIEKTTSKTKEKDATLTFTGLKPGYYLVDSSVGTLCGLNTTNPSVTIEEKNGVPTVEKKVKEDSKDTFESSNTADIGQTVEFQTTITAQAGAQNYVLHDKMDVGLTFNNDIQITLISNKNSNEVNNDSYNILLKSNSTSETKPSDDCTFEIDFSETFCNSLTAGDQIIVSYSATLNENAVVGNTGNENDTWLKYGNVTDTAYSSTTTKTYEIPVFKYAKKDNGEKGLAGAKFTLSKNDNGSSLIKLIKVSDETETTKLTYRVAIAKEGEASYATEITTPSKGEFVIQGLDADTYYLTETEAPKGYNKLATPITVEIDNAGNVKVNDANVDRVEVENKTGTLLPSTGGMGTTIIYMAGAILVIASGIVLVSKKKSKAK